jgi:membrane-associated phospholipid phosphatase
VVEDGFKSFPSGHSSTSFNLTVYASAYLIWCWHVRKPVEQRVLSFRAEFLSDVGNVSAKLWSLIMLSFAWCACCLGVCILRRPGRGAEELRRCPPSSAQVCGRLAYGG